MPKCIANTEVIMNKMVRFVGLVQSKSITSPDENPLYRAANQTSIHRIYTNLI